jgi:hypothetical protein
MIRRLMKEVSEKTRRNNFKTDGDLAGQKAGY